MRAEGPNERRVDALVAELQARVAERRQAGVYPADLEDGLADHFRRVLAHRVAPPDLGGLKESVQALERKTFQFDSAPTGSSVLGGDAIHRATGRVVGRHVQGALEQVREFAVELGEVLRGLIDALEDPLSHVHEDLVGQLDGVLERLNSYERGPVSSASAVGDLRARVERLEEAESRRGFRPWFGNERFEEAFRGSREELLDRYRDVVQHFVGRGPVIDIGCGRGEFLELLRDLQVEAQGVELDQELVRSAVESGLNVRHGDGLRVLSSMPDESLGGICLIQVIEHLGAQQVADLARVASDKLRVGGKILVETVNPQSLYVFAHSFYVDPTHDRPIHPAYCEFLFREAGFADVSIEWRSPPPPEVLLQEVDVEGPADRETNENWRRLNRLLFGPQDYALIAVR